MSFRRRKTLDLFSGAGLAAVAALSLLTGCGGGDSDPAPWTETLGALTVDLNGDGRPDMVSANATYGPGAPHPGFLTARLQADGTPLSFLEPQRSNAGMDPVALAAGDLNHDGRPDIVVANHQTAGSTIGTNSITVLFQSGTTPGTFPTTLKIDLPGRDPLDVTVADLDGDGFDDIVVAADGGTDLLLFFQNSGAPGTFTTAQSLPVGATPWAVQAGLISSSSTAPDLVACVDGGLRVLTHAAGARAWNAPQSLATGYTPSCVRIADLDGDTRADLACTLWSGGDMGLEVFLQDPASPGAFLAGALYRTGDRYSNALAVGKLRPTDTLPTVLVANYGAPGYPGSVAVLAPDTAHPGQFLDPDMYTGYVGPMGAHLADLDGDGLLDMVITDGGTLVRLQDGTRPGTFKAPFWLRQ